MLNDSDHDDRAIAEDLSGHKRPREEAMIPTATATATVASPSNRNSGNLNLNLSSTKTNSINNANMSMSDNDGAIMVGRLTHAVSELVARLRDKDQLLNHMRQVLIRKDDEIASLSAAVITLRSSPLQSSSNLHLFLPGAGISQSLPQNHKAQHPTSSLISISTGTTSSSSIISPNDNKAISPRCPSATLGLQKPRIRIMPHPESSLPSSASLSSSPDSSMNTNPRSSREEEMNHKESSLTKIEPYPARSPAAAASVTKKAPTKAPTTIRKERNATRHKKAKVSNPKKRNKKEGATKPRHGNTTHVATSSITSIKTSNTKNK